LGEDEGMLFRFQNRDYLRFWMKSTHIPLDIAFIDDNGEILQIAEMYPKSTRIVVSEQPCKYALEVNQGWFKRNRVHIGDKIAGLEISDRSYRLGQSTIGNPSFPVNQDVLQNPPTPPIAENQQQEQDVTGDQQQVSPKAEVTLDDRSKVQYAEQHNLPMQIIYMSKQSEQTLPPRKLLPVPGEGYPIRVSEGGEYFVAFDSSPTINGGDWQILGNQIKRFLFSNIQALEVLEEFVQ
jgi:uncharacterized membrane protein (UPF0127 family)